MSEETYPIFRNSIYSVFIIPNEDAPTGRYVIVNNETKVEEFETTLLPEALHYAIELQNDMYKIQEKIKADTVVEEPITEH